MAKVYGMEYYEACVPSFGSDGHPDLLAWDDAMDSNESDKEIWATFHDDEAAEAGQQQYNILNASATKTQTTSERYVSQTGDSGGCGQGRRSAPSNAHLCSGPLFRRTTMTNSKARRAWERAANQIENRPGGRHAEHHNSQGCKLHARRTGLSFKTLQFTLAG